MLYDHPVVQTAGVGGTQAWKGNGLPGTAWLLSESWIHAWV